MDERPKWVPRPAPSPPRPRQKRPDVAGSNLLDASAPANAREGSPPSDTEPVDLTEFAHSEPQNARLLDPDEDEQTLARPRASEPNLSELAEQPFALVNPPLPTLESLGRTRTFEPPEPASITTPPSGTEGVSRRQRSSSGVLLGFSVLSAAIVGLAVFFRSGQAANPATSTPPHEVGSLALAEAAPTEADIHAASALRGAEEQPPTQEPEPSASNTAIAIEKAAAPLEGTPRTTTAAARPQPYTPRFAPVTPRVGTEPAPPSTNQPRAAINPPPVQSASPAPAARVPVSGAAETSDAPFDRAAATSALAEAAQEAATSCRKAGDPAGTANTTVTFAPSGRVTTALLSGPPFAGTQTGSCIAATLRRARIPAFAGEKVTVGKTIVIR